EFDVLKRVLEGSLSFDKPEMIQVDNPDFVAWKNFKPGAKVEFTGRLWLQDRPGSDKLIPGKDRFRHAYLLRSIDENKMAYWFTETVFDANGTRHPPRDTEMAYSAQWQYPKTPGGARPRSMRDPAFPAGTELTATRNHMGIPKET